MEPATDLNHLETARSLFPQSISVSTKVLTDAPGQEEKSSKKEKAQEQKKKKNQPKTTKKPPTKPTTNEKKQGKKEKRNAHSSYPEGCGGTSMHTEVKQKILFNILVGNAKIQLPKEFKTFNSIII